MLENLESLHRTLLNYLNNELAKDMYSATPRDKYHCVVLSVRKTLAERWIKTQQRYYNVDAKRVYYMSLEFLLGRLLRNYLLNLNLSEQYGQAVDVLGLTYEEVLEHEWEAGLGNGGLGRLAACFLDSLATLQYPAYGYGIRYEYGIFAQRIRDGYQLEALDPWVRYGNPWEFPRPELLYPVKFYGRVDTVQKGNGKYRMEWAHTDDVMAMAYDYPVPGFANDTVNTLRLWAAKATRDFDLEYFNSGDYVKAVENKNSSENISKVLYPNDESMAGKELRLKQQFFFVSATLQDILRRYKKVHQTYRRLSDKVAIQLNDTHPAIAIAELMRILVDIEGIGWDDAWEITKKTFAYTNHTVLPEALEKWSEGLFAFLLPRHLQIIQELDRRFMVQVGERFPGEGREAEMAVITGDGEKVINMARLAILGSHTVNGVSELHSDILKNRVFPSFHAMMPGKFRNVTNGVTPRRWLLQSNPKLAGLITESIGDGWLKNLEELRNLEPLVDDEEFSRIFRAIKEENKETLAAYVTATSQVELRSSFLLDCQVKRFHEYKRQLLNVLHVITLYNRIRKGGSGEHFVPRAFLFAGKAAPSYVMCKLIIKLINNLADVISTDPYVRERLQIIFVPNYSVTLAQQIIPAAEVSEQISTAGYEASGTSNMKFTMNGALTIGTLDGANVEIRKEVGEENFFLFGLKEEEILSLRPVYQPARYYETNTELAEAINQLMDGSFSRENPRLFRPLAENLLKSDPFFVMADYASYVACQKRLVETYLNCEEWDRMAILNVARSGRFSSDRAIEEYAQGIWNLKAVQV